MTTPLTSLASSVRTQLQVLHDAMAIIRSAQKGAPFEFADEQLELAQSLCEAAAHRFLRSGDCLTDLEDIQQIGSTENLGLPLSNYGYDASYRVSLSLDDKSAVAMRSILENGPFKDEPELLIRA